MRRMRCRGQRGLRSWRRRLSCRRSLPRRLLRQRRRRRNLLSLPLCFRVPLPDFSLGLSFRQFQLLPPCPSSTGIPLGAPDVPPLTVLPPPPAHKFPPEPPVAAAKVFQGMINTPPSPRRPLTEWPAHILRPPPPKSEGGIVIGPGRTEFELRGRLLNPQSAMLFVKV